MKLGWRRDICRLGSEPRSGRWPPPIAPPSAPPAAVPTQQAARPSSPAEAQRDARGKAGAGHGPEAGVVMRVRLDCPDAERKVFESYKYIHISVCISRHQRATRRDWGLQRAAHGSVSRLPPKSTELPALLCSCSGRCCWGPPSSGGHRGAGFCMVAPIGAGICTHKPAPLPRAPHRALPPLTQPLAPQPAAAQSTPPRCSAHHHRPKPPKRVPPYSGTRTHTCRPSSSRKA